MSKNYFYKLIISTTYSIAREQPSGTPVMSNHFVCIHSVLVLVISGHARRLKGRL